VYFVTDLNCNVTKCGGKKRKARMFNWWNPVSRKGRATRRSFSNNKTRGGDPCLVDMCACVRERCVPYQIAVSCVGEQSMERKD
jgi:hypothetical protein